MFPNRTYQEDNKSSGSSKKKGKRKRSHDYEDNNKMREDNSLATSENESSSKVSYSSSGKYEGFWCGKWLTISIFLLIVSIHRSILLHNFSYRFKEQTNAKKIRNSNIKARRQNCWWGAWRRFDGNSESILQSQVS